MNQQQKFPLTDMVDSHSVLRDYTLQQERYWWRWMLSVSIPLLLLVIFQKLLGDSYLPWWSIVILAIGLLFLRILAVWIFQRQRKYHEEKIRFHQQKIDEGYVYLVLENGKQKFLRQ